MIKKKKIATVFVGLILVAGVVFAVSPEIRESFYSWIMAQTPSCDLAPFNPNCICPTESTNKVRLTTGRYYCEPADLKFNPLNTAFQEEVLTYTKAALQESFPNCDSFDLCPGTGRLNIQPGVGPNHRLAIVECLNETTNQSVWGAWVSLETGNLEQPYCNNIYYPPEPPETYATLSLKDEGVNWSPLPATFYARLEFSSQCSEQDNGKAVYTVNALQYAPITEWKLWDDSGWCVITEQTADHASIECNHCGHFGQYLVIVSGKISETYMQNNFCPLNGGWHWPGTRLCCASDQKIHECQTNLTWKTTYTSCVSTRYSAC